MKKGNKNLEKIAGRFSALMIQRIKDVESDWNQPWIPVKRKNFLPQNITGRKYHGGNTLMLLFQQLFTDYKTPVYLTFKQAQERSVRIKKGEHSFPVYHFINMYLDINNPTEKITEEEYKKLTDSEKDDYRRIPVLKIFDIFNLDQTDYSEKHPEKWEELLKQSREEVILNENELFSYPFLDRVFENQNWICPIEIIISNRAYYSPTTDKIVLPLKKQFTNGQDFYATALHEMTHSTGKDTRLNRIKATSKRNTDYAKEELVAELSAALMAYYMGIETTIRDDHAAYLKHWINAMKEEPTFLMEVLSDVVRAVKYTLDYLNFNMDTETKNPDKKKCENIHSESETLVLVD